LSAVGPAISASGHSQTYRAFLATSALPPLATEKLDIGKAISRALCGRSRRAQSKMKRKKKNRRALTTCRPDPIQKILELFLDKQAHLLAISVTLSPEGRG
jgi:hypothetical protein